MVVQVAGGASSGRMKPVLRGMKHRISWRRGYVVSGFMMELYKSASIGRTADRGAEFKASAHSPRYFELRCRCLSSLHSTPARTRFLSHFLYYRSYITMAEGSNYDYLFKVCSCSQDPPVNLTIAP